MVADNSGAQQVGSAPPADWFSYLLSRGIVETANKVHDTVHTHVGLDDKDKERTRALLVGTGLGYISYRALRNALGVLQYLRGIPDKSQQLDRNIKSLEKQISALQRLERYHQREALDTRHKQEYTY